MTILKQLFKKTASALVLLAMTANAQAALTDISNSPLITGVSSPVQPNVFLMMDDSGSMGWDYMPDNSNSPYFSTSTYGYPSNQCNGVFYDPFYTYSPPVDSTGASYSDASFNAAWTDGFNTGNGTTDLRTGFSIGSTGGGGFGGGGGGGTTAGPAYFYLYSGTQNTEALKNYYSSSSTFYKECNSTISSNSTMVTVSGSGGTSSPYASVSGITINSLQIMKAASATSSAISSTTMASNIALQINACTASASGNCGVAGYSASASSGILTITGPNAAASTPVITTTGSMGSITLTTPVFSKRRLLPTETTTITISAANAAVVSSIKVNGVELMGAASVSCTNNTSCTAGNIAARIYSNGFSATNSSTSTITITGPTSAANYWPVVTLSSGTLSYTSDIFPDTTAANLTNYANWYSYYRTRVNMMKTAAGLAFKPLGTSYRVGFATMNNNNGADFVNLATFNAAQKSAWYSTLYGVSAGNSTPLLGALAKAGLMYANKLPGNTLNSVTANDPIQYSCQQNYAILSTDGFWNSQTGNVKLDNTNAVGQQDGTELRPMYDGATATTQTATTSISVTRRQSVQNNTATTPWTRTNTTVGTACTIPAVAPANTTSAYMKDNKYLISLILSNGDPSSSSASCAQINTNAWICRSTSRSVSSISGIPALATVTDSTGLPWYLVSSVSGNNCASDNSIWSGLGMNSTNGVCLGTAAISGRNVTTQNQTYNQVAVGSTTTVNDYTTTTTSTVVTISGQAQPATTSSIGPVISPVSTNSNVISDTGAPGVSSTWSNTGGAVGPTCTATPPAAGATAPAQGTTSTTNNGAAIVTTLSGPATSTPATYNGNPNPYTTPSSTGGTSNTLADVAEYYYITDLRSAALSNNLSNAPGFVGTDVSTDNVPRSGQDSASWQHMTTFTLGLGARGKMVFSPTYLTDTSGDFYSVKNGVQANSSTGICSWQTSGTVCNWPVPNVSGIPENIDDLWHAAVDGRGTYFSATNPGTLALGLSTALANVQARTGASAAATTSNPNVTSGDNFVFSSTFVTVQWTGELVRQQLDLNTGATLPTIDWAAQALLDSNSSRTIYTYNSAATNGLMSFTYANLSTTQQAYFNQPAINNLSQLCTGAINCLPVWQANFTYNVGDEYRVGTTWYHVNTAYNSGGTFGTTDTNRTSVVTGAAATNLVNYLRGDRTNEGILTDSTKYFRQRIHILGDIVNAEAVYVKTPLQTYADPGYSSYVSGMANRQGMVYAAANDGMLHAFYSDTGLMDTNGKIVTTGGTSVTGGVEAFAYIPSFVLPNLYMLADKNYASNHQYYVDGTPISGDICSSNCTDPVNAVWKTIIVGGLNAGGRGYYALDVTNPAQPKALWEFTDTNMGFTFGNPEITQVCDTSACTTKTWAVLVTSGINNVSPGDGVGRLYVLNANTGALIRTISTGVGSTGTPSGLSRIIAQTVDPATNNTTLQVYGGDLLGNLWRFDVNGNVGASGYDAQLLITMKDPSGVAQPISTKPEVGIVNSSTIVYVGTGRYLGTSDLATTQTQTIYGIKDPLALNTTSSTAVYPTNPHTTGSGFIQQTQTSTTCPANSPSTVCLQGQVVRTSTKNPVNFSTDNGWYVDLGVSPDSGERASTDPTLRLGTLGFTTIVPSVSSCTVGGYSFTYFFDYRTGAPVSTSTTNVLSAKLGNALATRPVYVRLPNNTIVQLIRLSDGTTMTTDVPIGAGSASTRRVSRRELITE